MSFRTVMTGELFALLAESSVVANTVASDDWDQTAFAAAVDEGMTGPEALTSKIFSLRADHLLNGPDEGVRKARLSGWLIGLELAATRPYWLGQRVVLLGESGLVAIYEAALRHVGQFPEKVDGNRLTLLGLQRAYRSASG